MSCYSCGLPASNGLCSMCYGEMYYGDDGYYEEWAMNQMQEEEQRENDLSNYSHGEP